MEPKTIKLITVILFLVAAMNSVQAEEQALNTTEKADAILNVTSTRNQEVKHEKDLTDEDQAMIKDVERDEGMHVVLLVEEEDNKMNHPKFPKKAEIKNVRLEDWGVDKYSNLIAQTSESRATDQCCCYYGPQEYYEFINNQIKHQQRGISCAEAAEYAYALFCVLTASAGIITAICVFLILKARITAAWRWQTQPRDNSYRYIPSPPKPLMYFEYEDETEDQ